MTAMTYMRLQVYEAYVYVVYNIDSYFVKTQLCILLCCKTLILLHPFFLL